MEYKIRPAVTEDAEAAALLLRRSIREVCGPDYSNDEALLEQWCANKTTANLTQWIADPENVILVAAAEIGLLAIGALHCSGELRLCYAAPEGVGKGIGSALLAALEAEARTQGQRQITLTSTITAKRFYERNGYRAAGPPKAWRSSISYPMVKELAE